MKHQLAQLMVAIAIGVVTLPAVAQQGVTKYVRYSHQNVISYGILEGDTIRELKGNLFAGATPTGRTVKLADARLLAPVPAVEGDRRRPELQVTPRRTAGSYLPRTFRQTPDIDRRS